MTQPDFFIDQDYRRYLMWLESPEGLKVFKLVAHMALNECRAKAARTSINRLCEVMRYQERVKITNSYRGWLSDSIIREYPQLDGLIERRKRTKVG